MTDWWTIAIAAYAAVVSTGALFLEVRRWFESGPRLNIQVMPEIVLMNVPGTENRIFLSAAVTNRGNALTTITNFVLLYYENWIARIRSKHAWSGVIVNPQLPGYDPIIPKTLQPGEMWQGFALRDELKGRINGGLLYVAIYASHRNKPTLERVRMPGKPPEDAENV